MLVITAWTALICTTFFMFLTLQVIRARGASGISLGAGEDEILLRRMRGQANAAEQMPMTLIVPGLCEGLGCAWFVLVPLAALFTAGRIAYGIALGWMRYSRALRLYGMIASVTGTLSLLVVLLITLLQVTVAG